jgi:hypothetical protein
MLRSAWRTQTVKQTAALAMDEARGQAKRYDRVRLHRQAPLIVSTMHLTGNLEKTPYQPTPTHLLPCPPPRTPGPTCRARLSQGCHCTTAFTSPSPARTMYLYSTGVLQQQ